MRGIEGIVQPVARRGTSLALTVVIAALSLSLGSGAAQANGGRHHQHHHRAADATFTKWATTLPADPSTSAGVLMIGIVGGDVGRGRYAGQIISDDTTHTGFWLGHVTYEFHGHKHTFLADLHITEDDRAPTLITATIEGVVTQGWFEGAHVTGQYRQWDTCPIATPGNVYGAVCFQGTLHLQRGAGEWD
jgi:hypothetical protein